ncbi:probable ATP-dependent RNA helicase DHX35 [Caerostris extrusa]|uniref:RNA helicase n=1 Tax=Caerostris extrusa TaxID=172846 RepID=A0AAV4RWT6_CAEEX|nr:probable ATP-dependent RNA helicase DHX35 [Caerostris extrusa]
MTSRYVQDPKQFKPKFLKPGGDYFSEVLEERKDNYESEQPAVYNSYSSLSYDQQRQRLPIYKRDWMWKSTQIPQYLLESGWFSNDGIIGITQPRRVAATMLASRVAEETDYKKRTSLKLIISSATFEAESIFKFFNRNETQDKTKDTAVIMSVEGRNYPVDIHYALEPVADYIKSSVETAIKIHQNEIPGDILIFLTGQEEVEQAVSMLIDFARDQKRKSDSMKIFVVPLYGALPMAEQIKAFKPVARSVRKIVVSTNIAEASVTITGIAYVIDCCFVKLKYFNRHSCTDSLAIVPVSQASAEQRAGRAGRIRSGKAFRLCTEEDFLKLPNFTVPEMQRSNLAPVILQLKALGIENILRFSFPSAPPSNHVISAIELLYALGALDDNGALTSPLGVQMAEFPLHPMFSKLLLMSGEFNCTEEVLTIAAMLQVQNVFKAAPGRKLELKRAKWKFAVEEGDFITLLNVYDAFSKHQNKYWCEQNCLNYKGLLRAMEIKLQLSKLLKNLKFQMLLIKSYIQQKEYMRDITVIEPKWLYEFAPHYYQYGTDREVGL